MPRGALDRTDRDHVEPGTVGELVETIGRLPVADSQVEALGVTGLEGVDGSPSPIALVACTLNR